MNIIQNIENGELGLDVRNKLNQTINKINTLNNLESIKLEWVNTPPNIYFNFGNNIDTVIPYNTLLFNTSEDVFDVENSRIFIKQEGVYLLNVKMGWFDLHSNMVLESKLFSSEEPSSPINIETTLERNIGSGIPETISSEKTFNSTILFKVNNPKYYGIIINPSSNTPFPNSPQNISIIKIK